MKLYRFPENRIWKTAFWVFMFVLLMLSRSGMLTYTLMGFYKAQFLMIGIIAMGVLIFAVRNIKNLKSIFLDRRMALVILCAVLILAPMVIKRDWQLMYFNILICLLFAVFLCYFTDLAHTAKVYVVLLCGLSLYAILCTYGLRLLPDNGIVGIHRFMNDKGRDYYNFGLAFVSIREVKLRNFGIFREPGVYQYFILLALYLTNYEVNWQKQRSLWIANAILAVTMLTTMATGGVIELCLFVVAVFFEKKMYRDKRVRIVAIVAVCLMILVLVFSFITQNAIYDFVYNTVIQKFVDRTDSVTERTEAIMVDLQLFAASPIFGDKIAAVLHAVENNTTSTMVLYAIFGAISGSLNVIAWIALVWRKERCIIWNLAILGILFLSFNTQNLTVDLYFWLFPMMALTQRVLPLLKAPKKG